MKLKLFFTLSLLFGLTSIVGAQNKILNSPARKLQLAEFAILPAWWTISSGTATRASKPIESWECPYIYMFGGVGANGGTMNNIWKGTINRLTFKPII